ncbi:MAG: pyruvate ferredoxin oxidoreductase [Patescibacteria group bacterium]|nr:pyruvate ferredoxin oxidoreductase [Patescibacteria group bacterium]
MKIEMTGAQAVSYSMMQINPEVVSAFPITPQTDVIKEYAQYVKDGKVTSEFILTESEHSALSVLVGASSAGVRAMTTTSSAGLAYMFEILGIASGQRLPIVMNVVNRALSGPINIHCDHSDSMACRDSGWIQLYSENAQEAYDQTILGLKLAEKMNIPVMVMQDGFICSHCFQNMEVLKDTEVKKFVGTFKPEYSLFDFKKSVTFGPLELTDSYFETKKQLSLAMDEVPKEYNKISEEYYKLTKRKYAPVEDYKAKDADYVIVALNSVCGLVKDCVDELRIKGIKAGLLKIRMFRPFPYNAIIKPLANAKWITVLDRSESFGANAPVYSEILSTMKAKDKIVTSSIYGLGGREIMKEHIMEIFDDMIKPKGKNLRFINSK